MVRNDEPRKRSRFPGSSTTRASGRQSTTRARRLGRVRDEPQRELILVDSNTVGDPGRGEPRQQGAGARNAELHSSATDAGRGRAPLPRRSARARRRAGRPVRSRSPRHGGLSGEPVGARSGAGRGGLLPGRRREQRAVRDSLSRTIRTSACSSSTSRKSGEEDRIFSVSYNLVDVGGAASSIEYVHTDGGVRLAAVVPGTASAQLVDTVTSNVTEVEFDWNCLVRHRVLSDRRHREPSRAGRRRAALQATASTAGRLLVARQDC